MICNGQLTALSTFKIELGQLISLQQCIILARRELDSLQARLIVADPKTERLQRLGGFWETGTFEIVKKEPRPQLWRRKRTISDAIG